MARFYEPGDWCKWDQEQIEDRDGPTLAFLEYLAEVKQDEQEFLDRFYAESFGDNCE